MVKFKLTCPECGAVTVAGSRTAVLLELCPSCGNHVWDVFDALLADIYSSGRETAGQPEARA